MKYFLLLFLIIIFNNHAIQCQQPPSKKAMVALFNMEIVDNEGCPDPCLCYTACLCGVILCGDTSITHACLIASCLSSVVSYTCAPPVYYKSNFLSAHAMRKIQPIIQPKIDKWLFGVPEMPTMNDTILPPAKYELQEVIICRGQERI